MGNPANIWSQYGPAGFERPQRFVFNYSYQLPFGNPKGALGWLAQGWTLAGVIVIQDGNPLTVTDLNGGTAYTGAPQANSGEGGASTAQLCPGVTYGQIGTSGSIGSRLGGSGSTNGYFNTSAFCAPTVIGSDGLATAYGDSGLGILLGPGQFNWDTSLLKNMKFGERKTVQFRAEFFNLLNHPQFGNPSTEVTTPSTFGVITTTNGNPRIIQFGLKFLF